MLPSLAGDCNMMAAQNLNAANSSFAPNVPALIKYSVAMTPGICSGLAPAGDAVITVPGLPAGEAVMKGTYNTDVLLGSSSVVTVPGLPTETLQSQSPATGDMTDVTCQPPDTHTSTLEFSMMPEEMPSFSPFLCDNNNVSKEPEKSQENIVENETAEIETDVSISPEPPVIRKRKATEDNLEKESVAMTKSPIWINVKDKKVFPIHCRKIKADLYRDKFGSGAKGKCIKLRGIWVTPEQFEIMHGGDGEKDWKKTLRFDGKSLQTLVDMGILRPHAHSCNCHICTDKIVEIDPKTLVTLDETTESKKEVRRSRIESDELFKKLMQEISKENDEVAQKLTNIDNNQNRDDSKVEMDNTTSLNNEPYQQQNIADSTINNLDPNVDNNQQATVDNPNIEVIKTGVQETSDSQQQCDLDQSDDSYEEQIVDNTESNMDNSTVETYNQPSTNQPNDTNQPFNDNSFIDQRQYIIKGSNGTNQQYNIPVSNTNVETQPNLNYTNIITDQPHYIIKGAIPNQQYIVTNTNTEQYISNDPTANSAQQYLPNDSTVNSTQYLPNDSTVNTQQYLNGRPLLQPRYIVYNTTDQPYIFNAANLNKEPYVIGPNQSMLGLNYGSLGLNSEQYQTLTNEINNRANAVLLKNYDTNADPSNTSGVLKRLDDMSQTLVQLYAEVKQCVNEVNTMKERQLEKLDIKQEQADQTGDNSQVKRCVNCDRIATGRCSGCLIPSYCSAFCQKKDWFVHQMVCSAQRSHPQFSGETPSKPCVSVQGLEGRVVVYQVNNDKK